MRRLTSRKTAGLTRPAGLPRKRGTSLILDVGLLFVQSGRRLFDRKIGDRRLPIGNWPLTKANRKSPIGIRQSAKQSSLQFELLLQSANRYLKLAYFYDRFVVGTDK